jgi:predicted transcriptional regulator
MAATKAQQNERLKRNEEKWSSTLMEAGWTVLPSIILEKQDALGLDAIDVNILMHLAKHWWYSNNPPHPSKAAIAKCMDIDPSTVRRHIASMEAAGFIRREKRFTKRKHGGQDTNIYHFDGLIKEATPYAEELIKLREKQRNEDEDRRSRKRPKLVVDNTGAESKENEH